MPKTSNRARRMGRHEYYRDFLRHQTVKSQVNWFEVVCTVHHLAICI